MDISFISGQDKFNYRVCAIILSGNRILAMHDERSPYLLFARRQSSDGRNG